jgi:uncharacterized repeat protein (TIGR03803 family)
MIAASFPHLAVAQPGRPISLACVGRDRISHHGGFPMTKLKAWRIAVTVLLCAATAVAASAQTFTTVLDFNLSNGALPFAGLVQGRDGNFYGTTLTGGAYYSGTAFRATAGGKLAFHSFCTQSGCADGDSLQGGLSLGTDGRFYGTTTGGGANGNFGTVFKIAANGTLSTLYSFCAQTNCKDGMNPTAAPVEGRDGNFYGTTYEGGANSDWGTVYKITPNGQLTTLYNFCALYYCADGGAPYAGLVLGYDGNFYGTTAVGGTYNAYGTVFRITPSGVLTTLYSFCPQANCPDGWRPYGALVQATDGNFYGVTTWGGINGIYDGTLFRITPSGQLTTLYSFCSQANCADGEVPFASLVQGTDGNLYGTTEAGGAYGEGTIFRFNLGGTLTTLYSFCSESSCSDGAFPQGALIQGTDGSFLGTTTYGGGDSSNCESGCGTVFQLSAGLGPFVSFVLPAGRLGQTAEILGQGFTGTTSVTFNGTSANFIVKSDTFIEATVPTGGTTGYVTVTTPSGELTSNVPFHVIP